MFDTGPPRLFALPPGADFPAELVRGLRLRLAGHPPEAMARVQLFVNTQRMRRRITDLFLAQGATLLPRIRLVTDLGLEAAIEGIPAAIPPLRRRLELTQLVSRLLEAQPDLAPRTALYDLADSLATLMDEMQGEGVAPETVSALDVSNHSAHWTRTQSFMQIVRPFFGTDEAPDPEARQRRVVEALATRWANDPPQGPVIVAGSTASRGTTLRFMQAVAALPQGALVLPGYDFDLPAPIWDTMGDAMTAEDHPQYRFRRLMDVLGRVPTDIDRWTDAPGPCPARNRLVSLSLRPAPVTDQWLTEGQRLDDLAEATKAMTLIEAESPRDEALAIALILRDAAERGTTAALITPDRGLTRQVTAALDRWGILPDDSAGKPLALSAPGRLLRHVARLMGQRLTAEALLTLLKHPLVATAADRGPHLNLTRDLELKLRKYGPPFPEPDALRIWADSRKEQTARPWVEWIIATLAGLDTLGPRPLADHLRHHLAVTEALARGPWGEGSGELWLKPAGIAALGAVTDLAAEAEAGGTLAVQDYRNLFEAILNKGEVRDEVLGHPHLMIWGTLEARVQGAELVILGGLNDGIWPQLPPPDPWLNRKMRKDAGLLLPERRIGLAAHDYQQAIGAPQVVLTRAHRDAEAETVPSRWLNRLTNLLGGLTAKGGPAALAQMRARGQHWLALADALERPEASTASAPRPAPRPPVAHRPRELALTRVATLIRDPYAIYARYILRLKKLDPLHRSPDARLRGSILHSILETFVKTRRPETRPEARARLIAIAEAVLGAEVPWPAARALWLSRLDRAADFFLDHDGIDGGTPVGIEETGRVTLAPLDFALYGTPDRIDLLPDGSLHILDYKTGTPPTEKQQQQFDKQLLLAAAMAERGGFKQLGLADVARISYVGLGSTPKIVATDITPAITGKVWEDLHRLITRYLSVETGYTARRAMFESRFPGDYDHLARFGEWEMTDRANPEDVA
ncbi:double-strand break repair protein AddB [Gemmobacter aquatilis]|uniref:Double-strand break repair protein AddB n=1 Tax=Gemmobacter aquatilis TaxID=933059 RepID=A0A1H7YZ75_9RHOB|nr:double-strand break repair protein AddB [Gemmobacter aquatilis]SEM50539.1 double-strand break repair protein AddB [Gemmobacter aquatilis]